MRLVGTCCPRDTLDRSGVPQELLGPRMAAALRPGATRTPAARVAPLRGGVDLAGPSFVAANPGLAPPTRTVIFLAPNQATCQLAQREKNLVEAQGVEPS